MTTILDDRQTRLESRSITALGWSAIDAVGRQGVTFAITLLLARLLSPSEFGLIGMLAVFVALATSVIDSGFGSALIQRREVTEVDKSSVFYFNAATGAIMALGLFYSATWIAQFYRQPILYSLTKWMALNLFIQSFGVVQVAVLTKELNFEPQFKAGFLSLAVSGIIAVWMAWKGYGVWSLVAQSLVSTCIFTCLIWALCPWRPSLTFRFQALRSLYGFGSRLLVSGILNTLFDRLQFAVIGRTFSAAQLGYYTRASSTQQFPVGLLSSVVTRVTFPVFSQASQEVSLLRKGVRRSLVSLMLVTLPMMLGLAVTAEPLVRIFFGPQWLPCVPYLRVLSIAGIFWPIHAINLNLTMAVGRTDLFLRLELVKKLLIGLGVACTFRISVMAMVWAALMVSMLCTIVNTHYSKSLIGYSFWNQMVDLAPYAGISLLMAGTSWSMIHLFSGSALVQVTSSICGGAITYCTLCSVLRLEDFGFVIRTICGHRGPF